MKSLPNFEIWFKNLKIGKKILIIYIPLLLLPLFIISSVSNAVFTTFVSNNTAKEVIDNSKLIITRIEGILGNTENCANFITLNLNRVLPEVKKNGIGYPDEVILAAQIRNVLRNSLLVFPDVEASVFITPDGKIYSTSTVIEGQKYDDKRIQQFIKAIDNTSGINLWFPMQVREDINSKPDAAILTLGKKIIGINSGEKLGYLLLNVNENTISGVYGNLYQTGGIDCYITDRNRITVSSRHKENIMTAVSNPIIAKMIQTNRNNKLNDKENNMLYTVTSFNKLDWKMVTESSIDILARDSKKITMTIFAAGILCIIFAIMGAAMLSMFISKPLEKFTRQISQFKDGNTNVRLQDNTLDEIGILAFAFNGMVSRIDELIERVHNEQRKKREYELALIQAQIKPHFLYNTLDTIYALAQMQRYSELKKATKSLADFYRIALSSGREIITIDEEMNNVESYLNIQRIRYSDVFDYNIAIDENILGYSILKLTIQPLVENAIYHGLKLKETKGILSIRGYQENDSVYITVFDSGAGIAEEKLADLLKISNTQDSSEAFGLRNINERIGMYYGIEYGVIIKSLQGSYTEVTVKIPAKKL